MKDEVVCPHKDKCSSYPYNCSGCANNSGKKDYFKPKEDHYKPWKLPYEPFDDRPYPMPFGDPYIPRKPWKIYCFRTD